ncbi:MAG: hypothetical protein R3B45_00365 [Bdellovibrionota bacterium]
MTKSSKKSKEPNQKPLSQEALKLIGHIADILAEEFVKAIKKQDVEKKEDGDESGNIR